MNKYKKGAALTISIVIIAIIALATGYYFYSQNDPKDNSSVKPGPVDKVVAMRIEKIDSNIDFARENLENILKQVNSDETLTDELQENINSKYEDIDDLLQSWQSRLSDYKESGENVSDLVDSTVDDAFLVKTYLNQIQNSVNNSNTSTSANNYNSQIADIVETVDDSVSTTVSLDPVETDPEVEDPNNEPDIPYINPQASSTETVDDGRPKLIEGTNKIE